MTYDKNQMPAGATGAGVECGEGCSIAGHNHGAESRGAAAAVVHSIGDIRAQLETNAQDQENAQGHCGKFAMWFEEDIADLHRLMDDTSNADLGEIVGLLSAEMDACTQMQATLAKTAQMTRDMAGRL